MILVLKEHAVKEGRYTEEQIFYALKQAETGTPVAVLIAPIRFRAHVLPLE